LSGGCGTIGSFLALQLAQSGAGARSGRLVLFDDDNLMPSNLGRHLLGLPDLNRNKAEGCADHIRMHLPFLDIESRSVDVMTNFAALAEFDLVIDATGEEALSVALDHFAVSHRPDFPPTLHTWIVGNGGAAQALLCDGPDHACTELAARREASGSLP
jgi:tRNA A37 threonylcarbamoyladenosine dehydratase